MGQVVAYKRLKTMGNYETANPKIRRGRFCGLVVYERFQV